MESEANLQCCFICH